MATGPDSRQQRQRAMVDTADSLIVLFDDLVGEEFPQAFGVPFPESSAKAKEWARKKGLLLIPNEPLGGDDGIENLAGINHEILRLEGLRAAQEVSIGAEISPVKIGSIVKSPNGAEWAVTSLGFDGQELIIKTGFLLLTFILNEKLFAAVVAARDAAVAKYAAAQAAQAAPE